MLSKDNVDLGIGRLLAYSVYKLIATPFVKNGVNTTLFYYNIACFVTSMLKYLVTICKFFKKKIQNILFCK